MSKSQWSSRSHPAKRITVPSAKMGADPIATGLQQLFAPLAAEPIPDEFMALLDRIDAKSRTADAGGSAEPASGEVQTGAGAVK